MLKYVFAVSAALAALSSPAHAVTVISLPGSAATFAAPAGNLSTFNMGTPFGGGVTLSGSGGTLATGSTSVRSQPAFSDGSRFLTVSGMATLTSVIDFNAVSFFWGSIDRFNSVSLLDSSNNVIASFAGDDALFGVPTALLGNRASTLSNRRVTFTRAIGDAAIRSVRFTSTNNAFELDNFVFQGPIPEPATWMMLLAGFGLVGASLRRRNRPLSLV